MKFANPPLHMRFVTMLIALFLAGIPSVGVPQTLISGTIAVVDGDTLDMEGLRIRLFGIDAPEFTQSCARPNGSSWPCGTEAKIALEDKIGGQRVLCEQKDIDNYRRVVAVCRLNGEDINGWLVASGWAVAYREFSLDYVDAEVKAHNAGINIWNGTFMQPYEYRREQDDDSSRGPIEQNNCNIKGNISSSGERIYHVPGGQFYEETTISQGRGERLFCTERDAQAAGWRRSRR